MCKPAAVRQGRAVMPPSRDGGSLAALESPAGELDLWWSMIFAENRYPLFRIMP
jgi:hypothetical protein